MRYSVTVGMAVTRNCGGCLQDGEKRGVGRKGMEEGVHQRQVNAALGKRTKTHGRDTTRGKLQYG